LYITRHGVFVFVLFSQAKKMDLQDQIRAYCFNRKELSSAVNRLKQLALNAADTEAKELVEEATGLILAAKVHADAIHALPFDSVKLQLFPVFNRGAVFLQVQKQWYAVCVDVAAVFKIPGYDEDCAQQLHWTEYYLCVVSRIGRLDVACLSDFTYVSKHRLAWHFYLVRDRVFSPPGSHFLFTVSANNHKHLVRIDLRDDIAEVVFESIERIQFIAGSDREIFLLYFDVFTANSHITVIDMKSFVATKEVRGLPGWSENDRSLINGLHFVAPQYLVMIFALSDNDEYHISVLDLETTISERLAIPVGSQCMAQNGCVYKFDSDPASPHLPRRCSVLNMETLQFGPETALEFVE